SATTGRAKHAVLAAASASASDVCGMTRERISWIRRYDSRTRTREKASFLGTMIVYVKSSPCGTSPPPVHRRTNGRPGQRSATAPYSPKYPNDTLLSDQR